MWPRRALGSDQEGWAGPPKPPVGVHAGCRPITLGQGACLGFDEELWGPQAHFACICWWWPSSWEAAGDEALGTSTVSLPVLPSSWSPASPGTECSGQPATCPFITLHTPGARFMSVPCGISAQTTLLPSQRLGPAEPWVPGCRESGPCTGASAAASRTPPDPDLHLGKSKERVREGGHGPASHSPSAAGCGVSLPWTHGSQHLSRQTTGTRDGPWSSCPDRPHLLRHLRAFPQPQVTEPQAPRVHCTESLWRLWDP